MAIHHKIPRSRGGSDEEWNLVEYDDYTHAYEHALDFVLFPEIAPWFDCRMPAWPTLPEDLQTAVRNEISKRWSKPRSQTHRANISKSLKGRPKSLEHRINLSVPKRDTSLMGRYERTSEVRANVSMAAKGRKRVKCPHCDMLCQPGTFARWHGENCRKKP
jgi:hypothetical protein